MHEVNLVFEGDPGLFEDAGSLYVDRIVRVDEDVVDGGILEKRLERAEAEDLIEHLTAKTILLHHAEWGVELRHQILDDGEDLLAGAEVLQIAQLLKIDLREHVAMQC